MMACSSRQGIKFQAIPELVFCLAVCWPAVVILVTVEAKKESDLGKQEMRIPPRQVLPIATAVRTNLISSL